MQQEPKCATPLLFYESDFDGTCLCHDQMSGVQPIHHEGNEPFGEVDGEDFDGIAVVFQVLCD
jgi:hypothetical protein